MNNTIAIVFFLFCLGMCLTARSADTPATSAARFRQASETRWRAVLFDPCTKNWQEHWTIDGEKARIVHSNKGMDFHAGTVYKDDAHHAVMWTKESFHGDIRIDYEYTKLDRTITGAVTILYVQATGSGKGPYETDISKWAHLRKVPAMRTYFNNMNLYHISYAAFPFGLKNKDPKNDYIRARRYTPLRNGGRLKGTELKPDYSRTGLFRAGVPHKITVIKRGQELFMHIRSKNGEKLCHWKNTQFPPVSEGRIGLRHMYTRAARYKDFRVSIPFSPTAQDKPAGDLAIVRNRVVQDLLVPDPKRLDARELNAEVSRYVKTMTPEGRWPDIDYTNKGKAEWEATWHSKRLLDMARVYRSANLPLSKHPQLRSKILKGLEFWLGEETRARGWYHQEIFVPYNLGAVCLLLGDAVPAPHRDEVVRRLRERSALEGRQNRRTGSNLLMYARNTAMRGCLTESENTVAPAFKRAADEIKVSTGEGIQPDRSFHQHGALLNSGAYGWNYAAKAAKFAWLGQGTRFAFPEKKLSILLEFILDGQQWFMRGPDFDYLTTGRVFVRQNTMHVPGPKPQLLCMAEIPGPRQKDRRDFLARMEGRLKPGENAPVGNRFFWRSAMMVHRRKEYYASVRMLSRDVATTDRISNGANPFGHHLSDGAMCLRRSGNEYAGLYAAWDWRHIPGTTVEDGNPAFKFKDLRTRGVRTFVGGASDGHYGVAAMDFARGPVTGPRTPYGGTRRINAKAITLTARKAWFFFDRQIVCLGAGITGKKGTRVTTTLNQCRLNGGVTVSKGVGLARDGASFSGPAWVHHDGMGYLVADETQAHLRTTEKTGDWKTINPSMPSSTVTDRIFDLWIDHGQKPKDAQYVYHIVPDTAAAGMLDYANANGIKVLSNTPELQAVRHETLGITAAAFYRPGRLQVPGTPPIAVSAGCILLFRQMPGNALRVAFSKPDAPGQQPAPVKVTIGSISTEFRPPSGANRGRTVLKTLPRG